MGIGLANIVYWSTAAGFTGLLDAYPGAAVAYSLRLLKSDYSGPAIRVQKGGYGGPRQDIGFVDNELDVASLESFCDGDDGHVATWYDQSANANHLRISEITNQNTAPQIVSSGTFLGYIQNGNSFTQQTHLDSTATVYTSSSDYSTFWVGQNTNRFSWGYFAATGGSPGFGYYAMARENVNVAQAQRFTEGNRYSNGSLIGTTWADMYNALSSFAQGTALVQSQDWEGFPKPIRILGSQGSNNGRMKEYIIYPNQTISRTGVETNIVDHYSF